MTNRDRMKAALNGEPCDRLPVMEWAIWWDKTIAAWEHQDLPAGLTQQQIFSHFGLDNFYQFWIRPTDGTIPPPKTFGGPLMESEKDYEALLPHLFSEKRLRDLEKGLRAVKPMHDRGEIFIWFTMDGYFWFPRTMFGIENHLYAFYDFPELMQRLCRDLSEYHRRVLETIYGVLTPEFMTFAEDMSYNHGPMISRQLFEEFMAPYYRAAAPEISGRGTKVLVDSDGDVESMIPWFEGAGIQGVMPLERRAGVDVNRLRKEHPQWIMVGGFDKTVMHEGEAAMRAEFERLLPAMRSGRYLAAVDHQTPPDVSTDHYRIYVRLLREYAEKACR